MIDSTTLPQQNATEISSRDLTTSAPDDLTPAYSKADSSNRFHSAVGSAFTANVFQQSDQPTSQQQFPTGNTVQNGDAATNQHTAGSILRARLQMPAQPFNQLQYVAPQPQHLQYHHQYATPFGQALRYPQQLPQAQYDHSSVLMYQQQHSEHRPENINQLPLDDIHSENASSSHLNGSVFPAAQAVVSPFSPGQVTAPHYRNSPSSAVPTAASSRAAAVSRLTGLIASGQQDSSPAGSSHAHHSRPNSRLSGTVAAAQESPVRVVIDAVPAVASESSMKNSITPENHPILAELLISTQLHHSSTHSPANVVRYSRPPSHHSQQDASSGGGNRSAPSQSPNVAVPQHYHQNSVSAHASGYATPAAAVSVALPTFGDGLSMDLHLDNPYGGSNYFSPRPNFAFHQQQQLQQVEQQQHQYYRPAAASPLHADSPRMAPQQQQHATLSPLPPPPAGSNYAMPPSGLPPQPLLMPPGLAPPPAQQILIARMPLDALKSHQGNTRVMLLPAQMFLGGQFPPNTLLQMPRGELIQLIPAPNTRPGPVQQFFRVLHVGPPVVNPAAGQPMTMPIPQPMPTATGGGYRPFIPASYGAVAGPAGMLMRSGPHGLIPFSDAAVTSANDAGAPDASSAAHYQAAGGFQPAGMMNFLPSMQQQQQQQRAGVLPSVSNLLQPINENQHTLEPFNNNVGPQPQQIFMMPVRMPNGDIVMMPPPSLAAHPNSFGQHIMLNSNMQQFIGAPQQLISGSGGNLVIPAASQTMKDDEKTPHKRRLSTTPGITPPSQSPSMPTTPAAADQRILNAQSVPKKRKSKKQKEHEQIALASSPLPLTAEEKAKIRKAARKPRTKKADLTNDTSFSSLSTQYNTTSSANSTMPIVEDLIVVEKQVGFSPANSMLSMFRPRRLIGGAMPAAVVASFMNRNKSNASLATAATAVEHKNLSRRRRGKDESRSRSQSRSRRNSLQNLAAAANGKLTPRKPSRQRNSGGDEDGSSQQSQSSSANTTLDTTYDEDDDLGLYDDEDDFYDDDFGSDEENDDENVDADGEGKKGRASGKNSRRNSRSKSRTRRRRGELDQSPFKKPHSPLFGEHEADLAALISSTHGNNGPRYSLASCDEKQAREIRRRLERKRREHIKGGYDRLKAAVPTLYEESRAPPQRILEATLHCVTRLKQQERKLIVKKIELLQRKKDVEAKFRTALRVHFQRQRGSSPLRLTAGVMPSKIMNLMANVEQHSNRAANAMPNDDVYDMLLSNVYDSVRADVLASQQQQRGPRTLSSSSSSASLIAAAAAVAAAAEIADDLADGSAELEDAAKSDDNREIKIEPEVASENVKESTPATIEEKPVTVSDEVQLVTAPVAMTSESCVRKLVLLPRIEPYLPVIDVKTMNSGRSKQFRKYSAWKHVSDNSVPRLFDTAGTSTRQVIEQTLSKNRGNFYPDKISCNGVADESSNETEAEPEEIPKLRNGFARHEPCSSSWLSAVWPVGIASQLEYDYGNEQRRGGVAAALGAAGSAADAATKPSTNFNDVEAVFGTGAFSSAARAKHKTNLNAACSSMRSMARFLKKVALVEALVEANDVVDDANDDADSDDDNSAENHNSNRPAVNKLRSKLGHEDLRQRSLIRRRRSLSGGAL